MSPHYPTNLDASFLSSTNGRSSLASTGRRIVDLETLIDGCDKEDEDWAPSYDTEAPSDPFRSFRSSFADDLPLEEEDEDDAFPGRGRLFPRAVAVLAGIGISAGLLVGILALADFWEARGISFSQGGSGGSRSVSLQELGLHATPGTDCWVAYHGSVYDMARYPTKRHPAGPAWITPLCGTDGTASYGLFHSESLLAAIENDKVGVLVVLPEEDQEEDQTGNNTGEEPSQPGSGAPGLRPEDAPPGDCWIELFGNVYDLTDYAHPGPPLQSCGRAATAAYEAVLLPVPHTEALLATLPQAFYLGPYDDNPGEEEEEEAGAVPSAMPTDSPVLASGEEPATPAPTTTTITSTGHRLSEAPPNSCWVALFGLVYDLTDYVHPGPPLRSCGTDATKAYENVAAIPHTEAMLLDLPPAFLLGPLLAEETPPLPPPTGTPTAAPIPKTSEPTQVPVADDTISPTKAPNPAPTAAPSETVIGVGVRLSEAPPGSCWVGLHGNVYDLTDYVHPGPPIRSCGTDGTARYAGTLVPIPHTEAMLLDLPPAFLLGPLLAEEAPQPPPPPTGTPTQAPVPTTSEPTPAPVADNTPSPTSVPTATPTESAIPTGVRLSEAPRGSCWVGLHGNVYDLTDYVHPGPPIRSCGTDGTARYAGTLLPIPHTEAMLADLPSALLLGPLLMEPMMPTNSPVSNPSVPGGGGAVDRVCVSKDELEQHDRNTDCWIALYDNVYDITRYGHPGGGLDCGEDVTEDFEDEDDPPHPVSWVGYVASYLVGPYGDCPASPVVPIDGGATNDGAGEESMPGNGVSLSDAPPGSCWVVLYGDVWDLSNYRHPPSPIMSCGTDATRVYSRVRGPPHNENLLIASLPSSANLGRAVPGESVASPVSNPPPTSGSSVISVSQSELRAHNRDNDCWIALYGNVYDITQYSHPGGGLDCGEDLTEDFEDEDDPPHPMSWVGYIASYLIGPCENCGSFGGHHFAGDENDKDSDDS